MKRALSLLLLASLSLAGQVFHVVPLTDSDLPGYTLGRDRGYYGPADRAHLLPRKLALDPFGNTFVLENDSLVKITSAGLLVPITGLGDAGTGDGGPSMAATLASPLDLAVDATGNVFVVGPDGVRRISAEGRVTRVTSIASGSGIALAPDGTLYVAAGANIWRVAPNGRLSIEIGLGVPGYPARYPASIEATGIAHAPNGTLYIAEPERIMRLLLGGGLEEVVSGRTALGMEVTPDGTLLVASATGVFEWNESLAWTPSPRGVVDVAVLPDGQRYLATNVLIAGSGDSLQDGAAGGIYRMTSLDEFEHVTGCLTLSCPEDGTPAWQARLGQPHSVTVDPAGNVFVSCNAWLVDPTDALFRVSPDQAIRQVPVGEGSIRSLAADSMGRIYLARDTAIDRLAADGQLEPFATEVEQPLGLAVDDEDNLYATEQLLVSRFTPDGVRSLAFNPYGSGWAGTFNARGLAVQDNGEMLIAMWNRHAVIRVADRQWSDFAGVQHHQGDGGDGGPATEAELDTPNDVAIDGAGNVYIASRPLRVVSPDGTINSPDLRMWDDPETRFLISPNSIATDIRNNLYLATDLGLFLATPSLGDIPDQPPGLAWTGMRHGATFEFKAIAPGEILSVFGSRLAGFDSVRVLFDGAPAPVLYADARQINCVAPFALTPGSLVPVQVERDGQISNVVTMPVLDAVPGVFRVGPFQPAIQNQDGSLNGSENPAARGEIVVIYATGFGQTTPPSVDGEINTSPLPGLVQPVTVRIGGISAEVIYAGPAPGLIAGAIQINARVPAPAQFVAPRLMEVVVAAGGAPGRAEYIIVE